MSNSSSLTAGTVASLDVYLRSIYSHLIPFSVCGSDVHTITSGWGQADLPLVVGYVHLFHYNFAC